MSLYSFCHLYLNVMASYGYKQRKWTKTQDERFLMMIVLNHLVQEEA